MARDEVNLAFGNLKEFFSEYELESIASVEKFSRTLKPIYRVYHSLLVWNHNLNSRLIWRGKAQKNADFVLYLSETVSDICQCLFLLPHGAYKPAHLILRSAVENFFRCIGIAEDQRVLSIDSVYDLIEITRNTNLINGDQFLINEFNKLRQLYTDLCDYVHTNNVSRMSLINFMGVFPRYDDVLARELTKNFRKCTLGIINIITFVFLARFDDMHHRERDAILDVMTVHAKRNLVRKRG